MSTLFLAWNLLVGCSEAPVYQDITGITMHTQTAAGTARRSLEGRMFQQARACLYRTEGIEASQASEQLLGSIYILEVKDKYGDRMFELYTDQNMKGNKGRYYRNNCIYPILEGY